jgi:hypothetical protein
LLHEGREGIRCRCKLGRRAGIKNGKATCVYELEVSNNSWCNINPCDKLGIYISYLVKAKKLEENKRLKVKMVRIGKKFKI